MKKIVVSINGKYKSGGTLSTKIEISVSQNISLVGDSKSIANELENIIKKEYSNVIEDLRLSEFKVSFWDLKR